MENLYLSFDIETVANDRIKDYLDKVEVEAPSNYKDPEKIEKAKQAKLHKIKDKAGLAWWTGRIVCISYVDHAGSKDVIFDYDEKTLLSRFFDLLSDRYQNHNLIGKSSKSFDIPFVIGRALVHDIGLPSQLRPSRVICDVNEIFSFSSACGQLGHLSDYAFALGLSKLDGMDGSKVQDLWNLILFGENTEKKKARETLEKYCQIDSEIVHEMISRALKPYKTPNPEVEMPF